MARQKSVVKPADIRYLLRLKSEMQTLYAEQDNQIREMREVRELRRAVKLDKELRLVDVEVRVPTVTDECARVAATLGVNPAKLTVRGRETEAGTNNATLRENWTEQVFDEAGRNAQGMHTFNAIIDAVVADGGGWCKLLVDSDTWANVYSIKKKDFKEKEEGGKKVSAEAQYIEAGDDAKRGAGVPFKWVSADVLSVYPVWQGDKLGEMLEIQQRVQSACFREHRLARDGKGDIVSIVSEEFAPAEAETTSAATVEWLEHWDQTTCTYGVSSANRDGKASGKVVEQFPHRLGRVPYFFALGVAMNHWRGRKVGWSVSQNKRWLVEYLSWLLTMHANVATRDTFVPVVRERPVDGATLFGADGKPLTSTRWKLMEFINTVPGEKITPLNFPDVARGLKEQIAMVKEMIDRLDTPRVEASVGSGLEGAGFAIAQVLAEARIRHNPLAQSIQSMLGELTRFLWHLMRTRIKEPVWVYRDGGKGGWLKADEKDLTDTVGLHWELNPELPSAKLIETRIIHERIERGTLGEDQGIERLGDNPDEVRRSKAQARMRKSPWYIRWEDATTAKEAGMGRALLMERAEEVAQSGVFPGMTPPMAPGVPAMGNEVVPNLEAMGAAPGGGGYELQQPPAAAPVQAGGPGVVVPQQGALAGVQRIGP